MLLTAEFWLVAGLEAVSTLTKVISLSIRRNKLVRVCLTPGNAAGKYSLWRIAVITDNSLSLARFLNCELLCTRQIENLNFDTSLRKNNAGLPFCCSDPDVKVRLIHFNVTHLHALRSFQSVA